MSPQPHIPPERSSLRVCPVPFLLACLLLLAVPVALEGAEGQGQGQGQRLPYTLQTMWKPQAQFAGYYVALEKGFYSSRGLEVQIIDGGPGKSPAEALRQGRADFSVMWLSTALEHRARGLALMNALQVVQRSALLIIAHKPRATEGAPAAPHAIQGIRDLQGRKVGLWESELSIAPRTLLRRSGVAVQRVPLYHTVNLFLRGGVDAVTGMWYNEYHTILSAGIDPDELEVFFLNQEGVDFPEDGIYALPATLRRDPQAACAFIEASMDGWRYAFQHPNEALDIVLRRMDGAKIPSNRTHQRWMLERMQDIIFPRGLQDTIPALDPAAYRMVGDAMQDEGLISSYPAYGNFVWSSSER